MRGSLAVATVGLMLACTGSTASPPVPAHVDLDSPATFSLNGAQAGQVAAVVNLVEAYNGGRIEEALALLDDRVDVSDCDYRKARVVTFSGRSETEGWLNHGVADHDNLQLQLILNVSPGEPVGVVGVIGHSDPASALNHWASPKASRPQLGAKVAFDRTTNQITRFANGPYGGDQRPCRPTAAEPSASQAPRLPEITSGRVTQRQARSSSARPKPPTCHSGQFRGRLRLWRLDSATSLLADQVVGSDCDHSTGRVVSFKGRDQAAGWLGKRLGGNDRLDILRVYNASGQSRVVRVAVAGRPNQFAKVVFAGGQILALGLAGSGEPC